MSATRDYLHLHFIVLLWGFTAILGKLIDVPSVELVLLRTFFSAVGLVAIILLTKRSFQINGNRNKRLVILAGVLIAMHWILFFLAARIANVSVCLAGMATTAIWTSLLEPLSMGKRIKLFEIFIGALGFVGILVIFQGDFDYEAGFIVAVVSAMMSAVFTVINAHVIKGNNPVTISFHEMGFASLSIALFLPVYLYFFTEQPLQLIPQGIDWFYLAVLVGACTIYGFSASVELMRRLSAFTINLIVNLEPVYGILLALIIFGASEEMSNTFYLGTFIILLSVLIYPPIQRRRQSRSSKAV